LLAGTYGCIAERLSKSSAERLFTFV